MHQWAGESGFMMSECQSEISPKESQMKKFAFGFLAIFAIVATLAVIPASASAASLDCTVTPSGTASGCTTNQPSWSYVGAFVVTGLSPGSYTFQWSATPQPGSLIAGHAQIALCTTDSCSHTFSGNANDIDWVITVVITNTATHAQQTVSNEIVLPAYCGQQLC